MKIWTRTRYITFTILLLLLVVNFSQSLLVLIYDDLLDPAYKITSAGSLRTWAIVLYGLILFGGFPLIAFVIWLNRDNLQPLSIDRFYVVLLLYAGIAGLYYLPYNIVSILSVIYLAIILLGRWVKFGILDQSGFRMILIIIGIYVCILCLRIGFDDVTSLDFFRFGESARHQALEVIPISIYEEAVYRGMLSMFLLDLGFSQSKTLYMQAFIFWINHINYLLENPWFFWFSIPVVSLILGYIAARSKSITPSAIAHILFNTL